MYVRYAQALPEWYVRLMRGAVEVLTLEIDGIQVRMV